MKIQHQRHNRTPSNDPLAAWRAQLTEAGRDPKLRQQLMQRERELFPRFADQYQRLSALPRRARRALQRQWKRSLAGVALLMALGQTPALAATFTVTKLADTADGVCDTDCSLREAVAAANANDNGPATVDEVLFDSTVTGTITLAGRGIRITDELTITGPGVDVLTVDAGGQSRIFYATSATSRTTISGLTLANGFTTGSGGAIYAQNNLILNGVTVRDSEANGGNGGGGFIVRRGKATLTNSTVSGNKADNFFAYGGGFFAVYGATVTNSTVSGNTSGQDGGGFVTFGGKTTLINSTVSGNTARQDGGGFSVEFSTGSTTILNSTISGNQAGDLGGGFSEFTSDGPVTMTNSIVADNTAKAGGAAFSLSTGPNFSVTYSLLEGDHSPPLIGGFNIESQDPGLGPLQDNGGPTFTQAIDTTSPAYNAGNPAFAPPPDFDQRGADFPRVVGGRLDMGAFEVQEAGVGGADLSITKTDSPDPVTGGAALTYTLTVANAGPDDATGVTLTDTLPASLLFASASDGCSELDGTVTCTIGALASGANAMRQIVVDTTTDGTITNTASVTGAETDPDTANNTASESTVVNVAQVPMADLSVTQTDAPDPVIVGTSLTYTVTLANAGPDDATGVTLTDILPANVTFGSASAGCTESGNTVTCPIGALATQAQAAIEITVTPTQVGGLSNTAQVIGNETDPDDGNNTATEDTTVTEPPTPVEQIQQLMDGIDDAALPSRVERRLTATLNRAFGFLTDDNPNNDDAACGQLDGFVDKINDDESSGALTPAQADQLRGAATQIASDLGC